jgi:hypothetical protein
MFELNKPNRGTIVASAVLAAGVTGTIVDPDGPVGITLFALQLPQRCISSPVRSERPFGGSPQHLVPNPCPVARWPESCAVVRWHRRGWMGVLFTLWLTADLARPLVYVFWWGFCLLAAWLIPVAVRTAHRSLRTEQ